ncbi:MAG TPA: ankyrin repeat domain-containing protein [Armatimonadota bacterium]
MIEDRHNGTTDLHLAIARGDRNTIQQLLESQRELVEASNQDGMTPLHFAAYLGDEKLVCELVRRGARINVRDVYGRTPLYFATSQRHVAAVRALLHAGADPNISTLETFEAREAPLHMAARLGDGEIITLLLAHGADPTMIDDLGRTPAYIAQQLGQLEAVKIFNSCLSSHK